MRAVVTCLTLTLTALVVWGAATAAPAAAATTRLVSVALPGSVYASASIDPAFSANGRYVAFTSYSPGLVNGDTNGAPDVFVRDLETNTTERVSVATGGVQGDGPSGDASISANGRYVAFVSNADNFTAGDTGGQDVFVHDRLTGTTDLVDVTTAGGRPRFGAWQPAISGNGRFVAFVSASADMAVPASGRINVYLRDLGAGVTRRVSITGSGALASGSSDQPALSADGRYVAFSSNAPNLAQGDTNRKWDVFVRDRARRSVRRVSVSSSGAQGDRDSARPSISGNGLVVAFQSKATTLVPGDTNGAWDAFVRDRSRGATHRVSLATSGAEANRDSTRPSISGNGLEVVFSSTATDLVPGTGGVLERSFIRDRAAGRTRLVSVSTTGRPVAGRTPVLSGDGAEAAFCSNSPNVVPGLATGLRDVYTRSPLR